jgi:hypothetical protein
VSCPWQLERLPGVRLYRGAAGVVHVARPRDRRLGAVD